MGALAPDVVVRVATIADAERLADIGAATFHDTFGPDNTPADMALYVVGEFGADLQRAELADARNTVFFAERAGQTVGYAMLRRSAAPPEVVGFDPVEVARLYAVRQCIGMGIGATLMQRCLDESERRGHDAIWLGVWEHNARAIAFYRRWGFEDVGGHTFTLGRDRQIDRVMMRRVTREA